MKYTIQDFDAVARLYKDYLLIKNFSKSTLVTYLSNFRRYHIWCEAIGIDEVYTQDSVKKYLVYRVETGAKWQTMNSIYSAMRKLFREVLDIEWSFKKLPRPNKERHLPELLSQKDVLRIIRACPLLKHQAILVTLYASGLRSSELCNVTTRRYRFASVAVSDTQRERCQGSICPTAD